MRHLLHFFKNSKVLISTHIMVFLPAFMSVLRRYIFSFVLLLAGIIPAAAQISWPSPEVENLYKQAREFHSQGKLREAIVRYQQAIQIAPEIVLLHRELAHAYYLAQGYKEAVATLEPIIKQQQADAETYKIMAQSLLAMKENKKAKKVMKDAIAALPNSGSLYHQAGLMHENDNEMVYALESWLDGIQKDPAYHLNYYEAARIYMSTDKVIWAIIYGEIFVNIEQQTKRAYDTRKMLLNAYTKLFTTVNTGAVPKFGAGSKSKVKNFEDAVQTTLLSLSPIMTDGITTENLTMLRTRFIMDWSINHAATYPFSLFSRHNDMVRNGYFDIYNQWLFGKTENAQQYEAWTKFHADAIPRLEGWMGNFPYRPISGDFYNEKVVDGIFKKSKG